MSIKPSPSLRCSHFVHVLESGSVKKKKKVSNQTYITNFLCPGLTDLKHIYQSVQCLSHHILLGLIIGPISCKLCRYYLQFLVVLFYITNDLLSLFLRLMQAPSLQSFIPSVDLMIPHGSPTVLGARKGRCTSRAVRDGDPPPVLAMVPPCCRWIVQANGGGGSVRVRGVQESPSLLDHLRGGSRASQA